MNAIRVATICHNEDNPQSSHRRVKLSLVKDDDGMYRWYSDSGEDSGVSGKTLIEAMQNCYHSWRDPAWDLRARWL